MNDFIKLYKSNKPKIRLGSKYDGGYVIVDNITEYDLFISCGISNNIDFEIDFLKKYDNIKCIAFDGTISDIPKNNNNINFIKKNIGEHNDNNTTNLIEYLENYNNIFLKMDIETWEYKWIRLLNDTHLKKFAQIVIEIHFPFDLVEHILKQFSEEIISVQDKLNIISKLFKHHKLFHIHGNSACGTTTHNNKLIPNNIECTFVRNDLINEYELDNSVIPDPNLDNINIIGTEEIIFKLN